MRRFIVRTADLSARIRINLTKSSSTSVGARVVGSGGEGLYGRPRPGPFAYMQGERDHTPPPGDHKGPPFPTSSALAPTESRARALD